MNDASKRPSLVLWHLRFTVDTSTPNSTLVRWLGETGNFEGSDADPKDLDVRRLPRRGGQDEEGKSFCQAGETYLPLETVHLLKPDTPTPKPDSSL